MKYGTQCKSRGGNNRGKPRCLLDENHKGIHVHGNEYWKTDGGHVYYNAVPRATALAKVQKLLRK